MTQLRADERPVAPADPVEVGAEALIREARRRARRRRARWIAAAAVLVGLGAAVDGAVGDGARGPTHGRVAEKQTHRFVNLRAFKGQGELAFISRDRAWVLDGDREALRRLPVPAGDTPSSPVFSHDGRWLAYLVTRRHDPYGPSELWLARSDGAAAHPVSDLAVNQFVGWSPRADLLAAATGESRHVPYGLPTTLQLITPRRHARALFTSTPPRGAIWSTAWSPDGQSLAVSTNSRTGTQILAVPVAADAHPRAWLSIGNSQRLTGALGCGPHCVADEAIADLAGWWPRWGIAFWLYTSGMTHNSDSTPLAVIRQPGAQPRLVARTLSDGTTDAVSAGVHGELAVVASSASAGREYAAGKTVQDCSPVTGSCRSLPRASTWRGAPLQCRPCFGSPARGPGSAVSLDPAWSPDGRVLAYVKAPAYRGAGNPSLAWFQAHQLDVWNAHTNTTRRIGAITGSALPTWSRDGRRLLYVSDDGLWLADAATGKTVEIEQPLYRKSIWKHVQTTNLAFYGQIPWSEQFSWHSP